MILLRITDNRIFDVTDTEHFEQDVDTPDRSGIQHVKECGQLTQTYMVINWFLLSPLSRFWPRGTLFLNANFRVSETVR